MGDREKIQYIRAQYLQGEITLAEAEELVLPLIEIMNERGAEIAKKHRKRFKKLTFGYVFR